jgi:hypothetical protein
MSLALQTVELLEQQRSGQQSVIQQVTSGATIPEPNKLNHISSQPIKKPLITGSQTT